jgi:hypothetical protein
VTDYSVAAPDSSARRPVEYCNVGLFTFTKHANGDQKQSMMMVIIIALLVNSENSLLFLIVVFPCMLIITQLLFQENARVFYY